MSRSFVCFLLIIAAGLGLRCPQLDRRPMHNDEAVNALKLQALWEKGSYIYDPNEYHGPALYYAALPFVWLSPARDFTQLSEKTLRLVPVFFGAALIALLWLLRDGLGQAATLCAGLFTALSPAMVVSVILFTSFFTHLSGPLDSLRSYLPWLHRAGGHSAHIHPFSFYLQRLAVFHQGNGPVWSEGLILALAAVGVFAALTRKGLAAVNVWLARFIALYTILLTLAYSLISYKTPWCMLGFLH